MKILFLVYHGFSEISGITKKIRNQVKGLRENGYEVHLCHYALSPDGHRCRYVDDSVMADYGTGCIAAIRQRLSYGCIYKYCVDNDIDLVYARSFMNATPWLVRLFARLRRAGIRAVTEIPTFPYDGEFSGAPFLTRLGLTIDKLFRRRLAAQMDALVTFSDEREIFGRKTIRISNGVDFGSIPLHRHQPAVDGEIHLIGVAEVHYWHGFDRIIAGLGEYYATHSSPRPVFLHIVGGVAPAEMNGSAHAPGFTELIRRYGIDDRVIFHDAIYGSRLDDVFNRCDFAIGSLARHRSGITRIKTLKNREYATRGIPFIYSEEDTDFDTMPYVMKAPADDTPIDVSAILHFIDNRVSDPQAIRDTVVHLSWTNQMRRVVDEVQARRVSL